MGLPNDASNDLALCRLTLMAQQWAKSKKLDLSIKPMTESSIGYSQSSYPELDSQIKAARTRVLLEYVTNLALCLHVKICFDWLTDIFELKNKQKHCDFAAKDSGRGCSVCLAFSCCLE